MSTSFLKYSRASTHRLRVSESVPWSKRYLSASTEPGAGSDLAGIQTRAERREGTYIITGQKVWTSFAHYANWCTILARTDPSAARHRGLTYFLVDMKSPGFTVRPLRQMSGDSEFSELFLDGVEVLEQEVAVARRASERLADLGQRARIDLGGRGPTASAPRSRRQQTVH